MDAGIWEDSEDEADEDWDGEEVHPLHYPPVMDRCEEALDPSCQDLELIDAVLVRAPALCAPADSRDRSRLSLVGSSKLLALRPRLLACHLEVHVMCCYDM